MTQNLKLYFKVIVENSTMPNYKQFTIKTSQNYISNDPSSAKIINLHMCDENGNQNDDIISFYMNDVGERNVQDNPYIPHVTYSTIMIRKKYSKQDSLYYDYFCASGCYNGLFLDPTIYKFTAYKNVSSGTLSSYNSCKISIDFKTNIGCAELTETPYTVNPMPYITDETNRKITLYYRRAFFDLNGSKQSLKSDVNYSFDVINDLANRNNYYSGISVLHMTDSTWNIPNDNMISFFGSETAQTNLQNIPFLYDVYNETVIIRLNWSDQSSDDYSLIIGESMYNNGGTGDNMTILDIVAYYVTTASGVFYGYKKVTIFYDNKNQVRTVEITKDI